MSFSKKARVPDGDGADIVDHLIAAHADAVVDQGQRARLAVHAQADAQLAVPFVEIRLVQGFKAQLVGGVRGIGNEFTQGKFPLSEYKGESSTATVV